MRKLATLLLLPLLFFGCKKDVVLDPVTAQYQMVLSIDWNSKDYPTDYPSNAHFSKLIGWSHQSANDFFSTGEMATAGVKSMAEKGAITPLDDELKTQVEAGKGYKVFVGEGLGSGSGEIAMTVTVTTDFPAVTLVSMLAPSPDWYVAILGVNLLENDAFVSEKTVDVLVYDAGTDEGITFTSANAATTPQEAISVFVKSPLGNGTVISPVLATARFVKL